MRPAGFWLRYGEQGGAFVAGLGCLNNKVHKRPGMSSAWLPPRHMYRIGISLVPGLSHPQDTPSTPYTQESLVSKHAAMHTTYMVVKCGSSRVAEGPARCPRGALPNANHLLCFWSSGSWIVAFHFNPLSLPITEVPPRAP